MQIRTPVPPPPAPTMTVGDIYYVLFKHKWKILTLSLLGIAAAAGIYFLTPPPYESHAKLLIRYVEDAKSVTMPGGEAQIKSVDVRGEGIMASEADIFTSLDVALAVVDAIGVEKIVGKGATTTNREAAATTLKNSLRVEVPKRGNVLRVAYQNADPQQCQLVLRQVIDNYFRKHVEIHRNLGVMDETLTQLTDQAKARLAETEETLRKMKADAQITSLEETKKQVNDRAQRVIEELRIAEVELEERKAALKELQKTSLLAGAAAASETNVAAEVTAPVAPLSPEIIGEYQRLLGRLELFQKRKQELMVNFTPESPLVREAHQNAEALEKEKAAMIVANPRLIEEQPAGLQGATSQVDLKAAQMVAENSRIVALIAKITTLNGQLLKAKSDVATLDQFEKELVPLQRKKDLEEANYRYYATTLNQARFDNSLAGGQLSNIKEIQAPSLPYRDPSSIMKKVAMVAMAGIGLGLALAFLLEMVVDQSVRKSTELEKVRLPTYLTIPRFAGAKRNKKRPLLTGPSAAAAEEPVNGANGHAVAEVAPWEENHQLHPYAGALRDRLMSFFEIKGLAHKPKLVAITSCSRGAGVTTLAAGLAASLSETGDGNVLLVDMNTDQEVAHPFYKGRPACGLSDVLEHEKPPAAFVQDKLYMVQGAQADDRLPQVLPKRMRHLIPKLQESDYDYIIFDMPPITQTSVTPRLAGFMDMVFVVVEDEKTSREWLKQASALLHESKANLGAVFNKRRAYVPNWLHQEF